MLNKSDLLKLADTSDETKKLIQTIIDDGATMIEASNMSDDGIMEVKKTVLFLFKISIHPFSFTSLFFFFLFLFWIKC